jgi:hypothetical protein
MDEKQKPFDAVSIVIMVLLALGNDGAEVFFDLLAATVVGLPGEAIMEPIDLAMDGIFTFWFFAKCGFGGPSIIQIVDDILELVGVPGRTICVVLGILLANNSKLAPIVEMAGAALLTGPAGAAAVEAGGAAEVGAAAAAATGEAAVAAETTVGAEVAEVGGEQGIANKAGGGQQIPLENEAGATPEENQESGAGEKKAELEHEMETEEERPPEEIAREKIFEQISKSVEKQEDNEEEEEENKGEGENVVPGDDFQKRAEEIKKKQQALPRLIDVNEQNDEEDEIAA